MADQVSDEIVTLRSEGLADNVIIDELGKKGYSVEEINEALAQVDLPEPEVHSAPVSFGLRGSFNGGGDDLSGRVEEIVEGIIDEKWDELIREVKKIIEWKNRIEEKQAKMENLLTRLKEDFDQLHQGVLGKLETYDERMREVGTELQAVGKVFRDVVPEFVENVKELSSIKNSLKR